LNGNEVALLSLSFNILTREPEARETKLISAAMLSKSQTGEDQSAGGFCLKCASSPALVFAATLR